MIPLNEDGSLNIEFIRKLPHSDRGEIISRMNENQFKYYFDETWKSLLDNPKPIRAIPAVDDDLDLGWGIDAFKFLDQLNKRYCIKK